jgi:flagellar biosynthetic protein FliP
MKKKILLSLLTGLVLSPVAHAITVPAFDFIKPAGSPQEVSLTLQLVFLMTVLSLGPAFLIMMTSFTRIAVVLSFLKKALGANDIPPSQLIIGLALFLTAFIMMPVWERMNSQALQPFMNKEISQELAFERAMEPLRDFMLGQTREKDIALFVRMTDRPRPASPQDVATSILIPAFVISELKTSFIIGFVLYVPFLVIDMVVASILMSMGMMMLPPALVSLPFKLVLFVLVDGWYLVVQSLVESFR